MEKYLHNRWFYPLVVLVAVVYTYVLIHSSHTLILAIGLLCVGVGFLLALTDYSPVYKLLLFSIPLSLETTIGFGDSKMIFPSEAIMVVLSITYVITLLFLRPPDKAFFTHPVTLLIIAYVAILVLTSLSSTMVTVSAKYTLVMVSYIVVFYFMAYNLFTRKHENINRFYYYYAAAMMLIIWYALYRHSMMEFAAAASPYVVRKFYPDHAMYSACLAMMLPAFLAFSINGKQFNIKGIARLLTVGMTIAIATALFFGYSRAAWVSLLAAAGFYLLLRIRLKPAYLMWMIGVVSLAVILNMNAIYGSMKANTTDSSNIHSGLEDQAKSITSAKDASNAERLNRWSCAVRMFYDKPLTGFGPGTYQFEYLPYQRADEMTRISVRSAYNNAFGEGGSAHSEYLLNMSESGIFGLLLFTLIILATLYTGMNAYYAERNIKAKILMAVALTGFVTFSSHALFNNFLNNNKAGSLFWGLVAINVFLQLRQYSKGENSVKASIYKRG